MAGCGVADLSGTDLGRGALPSENSLPMWDACCVCGGSDECLDACEVAYGDNSTCTDSCDVLHGDNSTCTDCSGIVNGNAAIDGCGVCAGDNTTCLGCDGLLFSGTAWDSCDVCGGDNSTCTDCSGIVNGNAAIDGCGVCAGDNTTCLGCDGLLFSGTAWDSCDVCGGDNSSCTDGCGIILGDNSSCAGCDGVLFSGAVWDACGVCDGNGTTCVGCDGVVGSTVRNDACGVCGGDNATLDMCGVCDGDNGCIEQISEPLPEDSAPGADEPPVGSLSAEVSLATSVEDIGEEGVDTHTTFVEMFKQDVASRLSDQTSRSISATKVMVNRIRAGSVVIEFSVTPDATVQPDDLAGAFASTGLMIAGYLTESTIATTDIRVVEAPDDAVQPPVGSGETTGGDVMTVVVPNAATPPRVFGMDTATFAALMLVLASIGVCLMGIFACSVPIANRLTPYIPDEGETDNK